MAIAQLAERRLVAPDVRTRLPLATPIGVNSPPTKRQESRVRAPLPEVQMRPVHRRQNGARHRGGVVVTRLP